MVWWVNAIAKNFENKSKKILRMTWIFMFTLKSLYEI